MTSRQAGVTAIALVVLVQLCFVVGYFGLAGGGAITSSAPKPSLAVLTALRVLSFPGNAVPAHFYPEALRGVPWVAVILVNVLFSSLAVYAVLALGRFCGRVLSRGPRGAAA
jgi:hypothetical protein